MAFGGNRAGAGNPGGKGAERKRGDIHIWARGKKSSKTVGRGKGATTVTRYEDELIPGWSPAKLSDTVTSEMHSKEGWEKGKKGKVRVAGSNVYGAAKRGTYDESFRTRGDDPRNWEFHYKDPGRKSGGWSGGKGGQNQSAAQATAQARMKARQHAERQARLTGEDVYSIRKIEWEAAGTRLSTKQSIADRKASGKFGSTRVARNVAAAKRRAGASTGRSGRGQRTTSPFEAEAAKMAKKQRGVA